MERNDDFTTDELAVIHEWTDKAYDVFTEGEPDDLYPLFGEMARAGLRSTLSQEVHRRLRAATDTPRGRMAYLRDRNQRVGGI